MITSDQAYEMGAKGAEPTDAERLLFEAWMRGHCWMVHGDWDGKTYVHATERNGEVNYHTMHTRQLWAAWRDRAALAEQPAQQEQEWIETACALIKAADDAAHDSDYMLDSNDCIKVLRGEWKGHLMNDQPTTPQPAQRKPLTVPQIIEVTKKLDLSRGISWIDVIRAVEAAHGISQQQTKD